MWKLSDNYRDSLLCFVGESKNLENILSILFDYIASNDKDQRENMLRLFHTNISNSRILKIDMLSPIV